MQPRRALWFALLLALAIASSSCATENAIAPGRWAGTVDLGSGEEPMTLRVLESGGLLDLPERSMYGYPLPSLSREGNSLAFTFPGTGGELSFDASPSEKGRLEGRWTGADGAAGSFWLGPAPRAEAGEDYAVDTRTVKLPGTLLEPEGDGNGRPVALILGGAGAVDRDGNNYAVPGRCDSLRALAEALAARGVATLRYDKRGAGEAYRLVAREEDLTFDDYVADAVDALRELASDGRFSRVTAVGHGEGALVAAAALAEFYAEGLAKGRGGDFGLVLLCATAASPYEVVQAELASLPPEDAEEARAIMESLRVGKAYPDPSPVFADFFRPSVQPYLASTFRYDLSAELRRTAFPLLVVQGGRDPLATEADLERLREARPDAAGRVIEGMGRALKDVGPSEDEAYAAFSDPSLPLDAELADLLAGFARSGSTD
jgi:pimeloyl-ACP methyl ester carboxylesterase